MLLNPIKFSKILIVDDSPFFRRSTKKILVESNIGSHHFEAKDGKEAITQYINHRPHVVIMDIMMPNVDGIKATEVILKFDPNAKIIVISAKENREIVNEVVNKYGAKDYVLKPIDSASIVMAVSKQLVSRRRIKV